MVIFLSLRLRPTLVQGLFVLAAPVCGIGSLALSGQLLQQQLSGDAWRHISLIWLSLRKCLHTRLSVDVSRPNPRFWLLDTDLFDAPLGLTFSGDIGAIEVLIDWLNNQNCAFHRCFIWYPFGVCNAEMCRCFFPVTTNKIFPGSSCSLFCINFFLQVTV